MRIEKWNADVRLFLLMLLAVDFAFVGIHLAYSYTAWIAPNPMYSLSLDRGYPEAYQYIKFFWLALLCLSLAIKRRRVVFFGWFCVFSFFLIDDCFSVHEKIGYRLAETLRFAPAAGLRPEDFGEILFMLAEGTAILTVLGLTHLRSGRSEKRFSLHLLAGLGALLFFGGFIDLMHIELLGTALEIPAAVFEDGGEMIVTSFLLAFVFRTSVASDAFPREASPPHRPSDTDGS